MVRTILTGFDLPRKIKVGRSFFEYIAIGNSNRSLVAGQDRDGLMGLPQL